PAPAAETAQATPVTGAASAPARAAGASASAPAAGASAPAGTTATRPDPGTPKPFDEVIKGATAQAGFFGLWRKDEKLWLEIAPEQFDKPFLLSANISHSVGERRLYGSWMGPSWLASFRKIGSQQIQLIALNTKYVASGAPMQAAVEQAFSHSLLASATIASAPHTQRKSLLIDASFLLGDIAGYSTQLERAYRMPYGLDRGNSFFEKTRVTPDLSSVNARLHFATARLPAPPLTPSPVPLPTPPSTTPDARSFFIGVVYSLTQLPEQAMATRKTDPRLGHFFDLVTDLSTDLDANPKRHYISRWRLEKKDPSAAMSEPKQAIVYWLDKNIPLQYRKAVEAGVLEWNKAFERIGFSGAIQVRQQSDDADWDTLDSRHASIRWFTGADAGLAVGPNHSDPRTGEIIDADIAMSDGFGRGARRFRVEDVGAMAGRSFAPQASSWSDRLHQLQCSYAHEVAAEMDFALDLLEVRGDIAPDSAEAEAFAQAVVKDTITHEVGHTLGLKHNFKASTVVTRAQLQDRDFTEKNGISGSVMDYNAFNVSLAGERQGSLNNTTLGPYDYWAIEYAYRELDPANEKAELERIAARSSEPALAFADDADAGGFGASDGIDPLVNRFDLGDDPLDYSKKRLQLSRELWQRVQDRAPQPGDPVARQRRVLLSGFRQLSRAAELVGKYVGGMHALRDLPGTTGRAAYTPVDPGQQRDALQFLAKGLFNAESFRFKPQFLASLAPDYNEWERGGPVNIPAAVLQVQTAALDRLLSPGTAVRLLDLPLYVDAAKSRDLISLSEVYGTLQNSIWSELKTGGEVDRLRRNLQREHLRRIQTLLVRGSATLPPDALSLARLHATELQAELKRASANPKLSIESRAHLQDSLALLTEALRASMQRS
ncbi:MAG: zinc-dependent metalloprotease, partial [Burkholderiaceae bacterium]